MMQNPASFLEPERIASFLDLEKGDHVADFGAGHGYFTIPMARIVGGDGKVYAIDIQKPVLDSVRARTKLENLLNVDYVWADLEAPGGSKLKDRHIDFVLMTNILFQVDNHQALFTEAFRILREKGRLALIEWDETPSPLGPPLTLRKSRLEVRQFAEQSGFKFEKEFEAGSHHYGLLFSKP